MIVRCRRYLKRGRYLIAEASKCHGLRWGGGKSRDNVVQKKLVTSVQGRVTDGPRTAREIASFAVSGRGYSRALTLLIHQTQVERALPVPATDIKLLANTKLS